MLKKHEVLSAVVDTGVVLIVRLDSPDEALAVSRAAVAGGIRALEITLSVPHALDVVRTLADEFGDHVAVGVGTVLDAEMAVASVQAGARMLVSPNLNPDMIRAANRYQALTISGAFTPTEIVQTMEAGADIVKLFPTEIAGPDYLRTVMAPLAHAPILPAGGATRDNVGDWFAAGALAVGVGSAITKAARASGDFADVTRAAEDFLAAVANARQTI
ncbi:bifunctional 4-hydroxy-2-oxoglutarate aldolase/2-dehydro-3-deoxy-phosphogluconate aldolase [uncultured Microbacterium sp.]|uniref:bifunctional 4-hydroxy-2-oxoglutarate aldolase/2-dehydro-3-deoxy-phosphogluconate aldolase n=1 Tax=uncultured Microbacterium sp. TaxID=191216 RepID=UPI0025F670FA|nr:bifunctional 4-hydroxy-2-oxoglutarate aldolase/2-dehydro-3-deoxy-phosphogluconate aldolase [uncultured Microbacterium sp.]